MPEDKRDDFLHPAHIRRRAGDDALGARSTQMPLPPRADLMETDPTRVLVRQIIGAVAEYEKSTIVSKLAGARAREKAATGRCEGVKPFGHYAGELAVIERLKALRAEGLGYDRIAAAANAEGLPTRTGKPWHGIVINRILSVQ